jgi:undecaprenyl-diphosphatase
VHIGTLAAVVIVFYREILAIVEALVRLCFSIIKRDMRVSTTLEDPNLKMALFIVVGSIPTAILGLLFHKMVDQLFSSILLVGCMLLITGTFLWGTRYLRFRCIVDAEHLSPAKSLLIGLVQGLAVMPGISRSGSTIVAGLFLGLERETAARYSFLLSIPAIIGAEGLALKAGLENGVHVNLPMVLGTLSAFVVGYLSLVWLLKMVRHGQLHLFTPYCWILGTGAIVLGWG